LATPVLNAADIALSTIVDKAMQYRFICDRSKSDIFKMEELIAQKACFFLKNMLY
jgi:hypothetical protein